MSLIDRRWTAARACAAAAAVVAGITGCATGSDAVATGGTFQFVSPGGKTQILYDPPESRGTIGALAGQDLMIDGKTTAVVDYPDTVVVLNLWGSWCGPCRASRRSATALGAARDGSDFGDFLAPMVLPTAIYFIY